LILPATLALELAGTIRINRFTANASADLLLGIAEMVPPPGTSSGPDGS